ncbi:DNA cytosine methyltransferase [Acrocarpospora sp. B8E8]
MNAAAGRGTAQACGGPHEDSHSGRAGWTVTEPTGRPAVTTPDTELRIGSLCTGYGGLDLAVAAVLGGRTLWCADNDRHVARILDARLAGVPNPGDITTAEWESVPAVDVITAGFPCQDISYAGRGAGISKETRSGVWFAVADAVRLLRPRLVVLEKRSRPAQPGTRPRTRRPGRARVRRGVDMPTRIRRRSPAPQGADLHPCPPLRGLEAVRSVRTCSRPRRRAIPATGSHRSRG